MQVRPLEHGDIAALQDLDRAAHGEAWSAAAFAEQVDHKHYRHLVVADDEAIVGHGAVWRDGGVLRLINLAVDPRHTGTGVAHRLLLALFADVDGLIRLELEVRPSNRRAQRLYSRFGFAPSGIARGFYDRRDDTGSTDAIVMVLDDPADPSWQARWRTIADGVTASDQTDKGAAA